MPKLFFLCVFFFLYGVSSACAPLTPEPPPTQVVLGTAEPSATPLAAVVAGPAPSETRAAVAPPTPTETPSPRPNVLKPFPEIALPDIQIVPDPGNKYVDTNYNVYGSEITAKTVFKTAYYQGEDVIVTVNFYNKQDGQFHPDKKVRFVNGKGKALFFGGSVFTDAGVGIESVYEGTVVSLTFKDKKQFDILNSSLDLPAVAATGASFINQKIIEYPPK
ncbi:MAG: hypothetical protein HY257_05965 [Chloroflexi bacterium]|nr:hypothetical protein [Chloroflexota bacterium]